jgi:non-specific serine/threonine protein kinase
MAESDEGFAPLRRLIKPFLLRRLKTDPGVAPDLPPKTEVNAYCHLTKRQAALYQRALRDLKRELAEAGEDKTKRGGVILGSLLRFKQICDHPSLFNGDAVYAPADSGKFARLREIAEGVADRREKMLIFSQFREMTDPLAEFLAEVFGVSGLILHGGTPVEHRPRLVERFQSDEGPPFFVISLKAGGTGLNLTAASHVVHFDRWWNPAVEDQATDRAFRIGQKRAVLVHKFVCEGTMEERIDSLIAGKRALAADVLSNEGSAVQMLNGLGDEELLDLMRLEEKDEE